MSKPDIHSTFLHLVDNLENHKSGLVNEHGKEARTALEKGDYNLAKHYIDKGHDLSRHFDRIHTAASLLTKSKDDDAVTHAKDSLLNLHSGYFKKAQHHLDLATDFHNEKSKDSVAESNESNPESMADYHHSEVKPSKTGEIYAKSKGPTTTSVKPSGTSTHIKAGKTGEKYEDVKIMSQDKYTKLAEAAFGSLNQNNPFRNAPMKEEVEYLDEVSYEKAKKTLVDLNKIGHDRQDPATTRFVRHDLKAPPGAYLDTSGERNVARSFDNIARHIERKHGRAAAAAAAHAAIGGPFKSSDSYGSAWVSDKFKALAAEHKPEKMDEKETMEEGDVIKFPGKPKPTPKPSKVITTATRRPAGPRPVKENLNQRFPDVERDIAAIMKESYKKKKMMEDATNMHITTPEQREDWLNVGRGAMDVVDYINKYKV